MAQEDQVGHLVDVEEVLKRLLRAAAVDVGRQRASDESDGPSELVFGDLEAVFPGNAVSRDGRLEVLGPPLLRCRTFGGVRTRSQVQLGGHDVQHLLEVAGLLGHDLLFVFVVGVAHRRRRRPEVKLEKLDFDGVVGEASQLEVRLCADLDGPGLGSVEPDPAAVLENLRWEQEHVGGLLLLALLDLHEVVEVPELAGLPVVQVVEYSDEEGLENGALDRLHEVVFQVEPVPVDKLDAEGDVADVDAVAVAKNPGPRRGISQHRKVFHRNRRPANRLFGNGKFDDHPISVDVFVEKFFRLKFGFFEIFRKSRLRVPDRHLDEDFLRLFDAPADVDVGDGDLDVRMALERRLVSLEKKVI